MFKILIADDEQLEREAIKAVINKGIDSVIEIHEAGNGREAVVVAKSFNPDIIFMDIKMPGINGIEAARIIREYSSNISLVFLTAFNQFDYAQEAIQIGVDDFIIKPAPESWVLAVMRKIMKKIEKERAEHSQGEDNELRLNRVKEYLETEFVYNLAIRGLNEDKFTNYLTILDLPFYGGIGCIAALQFNTYPISVGSDYHKQVLGKRAAFIIKSVVNARGFPILLNLELTNIYFVVIQPSQETPLPEERDWTSLAGEIFNEVKKRLTIEIFVGFGKVFYHPENSVSSFAAAKMVLSKRLFSADKHDIALTGPPHFLNLEIELEEALLKEKRDDVLEVFQKLRERIETEGFSFAQTKKYILELSIVIKHSPVYQFPGVTEHIDFTGLNNALNVTILMDEFIIFLNTLLQYKLQMSEMYYSPAVESASQFIDDNYRNNISLEDAASIAGLSSFYFSRVFKKSKGITFIEYLTSLRIDEAKRLLKKTSLSIREISETIGYGDQNYFTRVFKRSESISPSAFRAK